MAQDAYHEDLAWIHDVGFGGFSRKAAPGLLKILKDAGIERGRLVDLGCGSGIWARAAADAGFDVTGTDLSPAMIDLARARVPEADLRVGSFLEADLPPCDAVTALGEIFSYRFDRRNSLETLQKLFTRIHAALRPGGVLIFDIAEPGRGEGPKLKHFAGDGWEVVMKIAEDEAGRRLTREITSFRQIGDLWRRSHEIHELQLYRRSEIAAALRSAGFRVRTLNAYGPQPMIPGCVAFRAVRK